MAFNDYFQSSTPDLSFEEKLHLFKSNSLKAMELRSQINNSQGNKLVRVQTLPNEDKTIKENTTKPLEISPFIKEIYDRISLLNINSLEEYEILEKIKEVFSSNLNSITINRIKLLLYKDYILYSKMLLSIDNEKDALKLQKLISDILIKIEALDEIEELENEEDYEEESPKKLFFLLSESGKVIALESLRKDIPTEYYEDYKKLILALKQGYAKGVKKLVKKSYSELRIRRPGLRLLFSKLDNDSYLIIDVFVKKINSGDYLYNNQLNNLNNQHLRAKDTYKARCGEEDFIKEHEGYLSEILTLLTSENLEGEIDVNRRSI